MKTFNTLVALLIVLLIVLLASCDVKRGGETILSVDLPPLIDTRTNAQKQEARQRWWDEGNAGHLP